MPAARIGSSVTPEQSAHQVTVEHGVGGVGSGVKQLDVKELLFLMVEPDGDVGVQELDGEAGSGFSLLRELFA